MRQNLKTTIAFFMLHENSALYAHFAHAGLPVGILSNGVLKKDICPPKTFTPPPPHVS
ncbi:hypothetical protein HBZS_122550 [Helicobacter bizzozeronii CCUG 35545]|nr:hypothetical protein HBZS_122550 [Helicobacter bizzozeronii CCUG 35545]